MLNSITITLLIAGSRSITDYSIVEPLIDQAIVDINSAIFELYGGKEKKRYTLFDKKPQIPELNIVIISGGAAGVDSIAEKYATNKNIKFKKYPANWHKYGKGAGYIRNKEMVDAADVCVVIWDGISKGTTHTIDLSRKKEIPLTIHTISQKGSAK